MCAGTDSFMVSLGGVAAVKIEVLANIHHKLVGTSEKLRR